MISRRTMATGCAALALAFAGAVAHAQAGKSPDALIKEVSTDVLDVGAADKSIQAGDVQKIDRPGRRQGAAARRTSSA